MTDLPAAGSYLMALLFVLALIGVAALAAKRFGFVRAATSGGGKRRIAVIDTLAIDGKRRLLLIRRDGVEHLVLLGATSETVIEAGIGVPQS
ncbi:MAG: flagellar biosynthetic protein FliO [Rhodospirillales bacterium]|jgi:flagellar protein FliO/FliZ|nr:flagellar biosynthetic protein FliO [Rhodospirillales bacterium]